MVSWLLIRSKSLLYEYVTTSISAATIEIDIAQISSNDNIMNMLLGLIQSTVIIFTIFIHTLFYEKYLNIKLFFLSEILAVLSAMLNDSFICAVIWCSLYCFIMATFNPCLI